MVASFVALLTYLVLSHHVPGAGFIGCPFRALTGYSCFGCGMTRSTALFLHGSWGASFAHHPFGGAFVLAWGASAAHHLAQNLRGKRLDYGALRLWKRIEKPVLGVTFVFLVLFGLIRFALEVSGILTPI